MLGHLYMLAFRWRADDVPLIEVFGSSLPPHQKQNLVEVGPPLTKLSGSAHGSRGGEGCPPLKITI